MLVPRYCLRSVHSLYIVGHGKSGGDRVHINTFDTYVLDVANHIRDFKSQHPEAPCFLMGHSMVCI